VGKYTLIDKQVDKPAGFSTSHFTVNV